MFAVKRSNLAQRLLNLYRDAGGSTA